MNIDDFVKSHPHFFNEKDSKNTKRLIQLVRQCPYQFKGSEKEQKRIIDLRNNMENWQSLLLDYHNNKNWEFPMVLRRLLISKNVLRKWDLMAVNKNLTEEEMRIALEEDERLRQLPTDYRKPSVKMLEEIVDVFIRLQDLWVGVSIKFTLAVANRYISIVARRSRCQGVVDIN
ncbi:uncharacterized protein LOC106653471 [Trichogramma pretiosum]|uniref:uncharacterized protein LOC106653471 n=1 Tax=Trichogramma pretiosum TaxID=7493 RepID=UPI0006C9956A|nr:uncharacterized protein LOC106653471 [Trichogramma pretiosum]